MKTNSKNTYQLLHQITKHLSSRPECKKEEFEVVIDSKNKVMMSPRHEVFPSNKRRKKSDKQDVIVHILNEHVDSIEFVPGRYVYKQSGKAVNRRWWKYPDSRIVNGIVNKLNI